MNPLPQAASRMTLWTRRQKRKRSPTRTLTTPGFLKTRLSWTTSSGFGWLVPSILRLWLLHGRHRTLEPVMLQEGPRTPGAMGPEGRGPSHGTTKFWNATVRFPTERILLGAGSHTHPPCKREGRLHAWFSGVPFSCGYLTLTTCRACRIAIKVYVRRHLPKWLCHFGPRL